MQWKTGFHTQKFFVLSPIVYVQAPILPPGNFFTIVFPENCHRIWNRSLQDYLKPSDIRQLTCRQHNKAIPLRLDLNWIKNSQSFGYSREKGDRLGFIAEDCMVTGDVYIYKKETSTVEKTSFSELIGSPDNVSRLHLWEQGYSLVTSSVVLSVLVVGNVIDSSSEHLVPGCYLRLLQKWDVEKSCNLPYTIPAILPADHM